MTYVVSHWWTDLHLNSNSSILRPFRNCTKSNSTVLGERPSWTMSRIYFWESLKDVTDTVWTRSSLTWYFARISNQLPYVYASGLSDPTKGGVSQIKAELGHQNFCTIMAHEVRIHIPQIIFGYCQMTEVTLHLQKVAILFCHFQCLIKISWNPHKM